MKKFIASSLVALLFPATVWAVSLGNNYDCSGKSIKLKGKLVTLAVAKKGISTSISRLKSQLKSAKKGSKASTKIKTKISTFATLLSSVKSCAAGTFVPTGIRSIAAAFPNGSWHNTTFNTSGGIGANFSLTGTILSVSINIGGSMFGSLTPGPVEIQQDLSGVTYPFQFQVTGTTIGDLSVTIGSNGSLYVVESVVPSLPNILRAELSVVYSAGTFSGTFHSFLSGNIKLADGTLSLSK